MIPVTVAFTPQQTPAGPQSLVRRGKMAPINGTPKHTSIHNLLTDRNAYTNQDPVKFHALSHMYTHQLEPFERVGQCDYYCSRSTLHLRNHNLCITLVPCDTSILHENNQCFSPTHHAAVFNNSITQCFHFLTVHAFRFCLCILQE